MEILGYFLAIIMGFTLGLLGGGGSILTVPILVYIMGVDPVTATAYSLFVVGSTAVIGGWRKHRVQQVEWKTGILFALPSLLAVFATRYWIIPAIPEIIHSFNDFDLTKDLAIMVFFALIMLLTGFSMIMNGAPSEDKRAKEPKIGLVILEGLVVGIVTGLVGAGGGFLIVPALVLLVGLPMKKAVGTSLVIIALKSLIGFLGDLGSGQDIDWLLLLLFTAFSIVGLFIGIWATKKVNQKKLKDGFGWFVLVMAAFILIKELLL